MRSHQSPVRLPARGATSSCRVCVRGIPAVAAAALLGMIASGSAAAQVASEQPGPTDPTAAAADGAAGLPAFDIIDADGDGRLYPVEWRPVLKEPFDDFDADGSGYVDVGEYDVYLERRRLTIESLPAPSDLPQALQPVEDEAQFEFSRGNYEKASKMFALLAEKVPALPEFKFRLAECYFQMNRIGDARGIYQNILDKEGDNVVALIAMARIEAKAAAAEADQKKRTDQLDKARASLLTAAELGANTLKAVQAHPELKRFTDDVSLLIDLAKAWQKFESVSAVRDPFVNPMPRKDAGTQVDSGTPSDLEPSTRWDLERQRIMVERLKGLVVELREAISLEDFQRVAELWSEIEDILRYEKSITDSESAVVIRRLKEEVKANESVVQSLLLSAYYATGERLLGEMREALDAQQFTELFELWERLNEHADRMKKTENEIFIEKAQDLLARGQALERDGRILEEIGRFTIAISATVVGGGVAKAIVNNRVLAEGDWVYDFRGNPITSLKVLVIERRRVRFSYKGLEFVRELQRST
jgi:tetratricopeptide (TPR) repeat protein